MKRVLLLMLALSPFGLFAQHIDVGLFLGGSTYQGDLSPKTVNFSTSDVHPSLGVFARYNFNRFVSARASFTYGKVSGDDASSNEEGRLQRNLSFQSNIIELGVMGELNLFGYDPQGLSRRFSPYIFGGIALFNFNPEANYNGQLVELQPLGTEGQGMEGFDEKYKLTQISIPMGVGVKFAITERLNLGVEVGMRKTFTDYLDDVSTNYVNYNDLSRENGTVAANLANRTGELLGTEPVIVATGTQRGNPDSDDWYAMGGVTLSYNFFSNKNGLGRKNRNDFGCPKF